MCSQQASSRRSEGALSSSHSTHQLHELERSRLFPQKPFLVLYEQQDPQEQQDPDVTQPAAALIQTCLTSSDHKNTMHLICSRATDLSAETSSDTTTSTRVLVLIE